MDEHARTGYSKEEITEKMETAGFTAVDVAYTYGRKGHLAWVYLIKSPMMWLTQMKLWALPLLMLYYIPILPVSLVLMQLDISDDNEYRCVRSCPKG